MSQSLPKNSLSSRSSQNSDSKTEVAAARPARDTMLAEKEEHNHKFDDSGPPPDDVTAPESDDVVGSQQLLSELKSSNKFPEEAEQLPQSPVQHADEIPEEDGLGSKASNGELLRLRRNFQVGIWSSGKGRRQSLTEARRG